MFVKVNGLCALLGILSLAAAYKITPNVVDGIPGSLNISTAPFVKIGSGYYLIVKDVRRNWYDAFETCGQMEANLFAPESLEQFKLVAQHLNERNPTSYWTAGTDLAKQGKHVWFSNKKPVPSSLWGPGQPDNNNNNEHCDELKFHEGGWFELNDAPCTSGGYLICEAPQPKTASFIIW